MAGCPHWGEFDTPAVSTQSRPGATQSVTPKLKLLLSNPPDLVRISSSKEDDSAQQEFGVMPADFLHSLQLQVFLKKAASGQQTPLPILKQPGASVVPAENELQRGDVMTLIRRIVILTCVDCGYERASESCLRLLTESCGRFIQKICAELASHRTSQQWSSTQDEEYLYQLLDEIGFSIPTLHHFVKNISERKHERLLRVNRLYGPVADSCIRPPVRVNDRSSNVSQMIVGLEEDAAGVTGEEKMWDQSLDEMSQMTDEEILQTLTSN